MSGMMTKAAAAAAAVALAGTLGYFGTKLFKRGSENGGKAAAAAETTDAGAPKVARVAHWQVKYHDDQAGDVEGTALVDWDAKRATVTFDRPATGTSTKSILAADDVT